MTDQSFTLANGVVIPAIGFGTWQIEDGDAAYTAVTEALKAGYRHIDTARGYGNETNVGRAIRDSGIPREQIFVTSKLPAEVKDAEGARESFDVTLTSLGLEYLDLYLIHAPWPWAEAGADYAAKNKEVWTVFEELYAAGRVRAIGVSNFVVKDLEAILDGCSVKPMVDQIKFFIGNTQPEVTDFCASQGIQVAGFSPLATGAILDNKEVGDVAKRYGVSVAQLCVRYVIQKGVVTLPKSTRANRMSENRQVDFTISEEHMAKLDELTNTVSIHHGPQI